MALKAPRALLTPLLVACVACAPAAPGSDAPAAPRPSPRSSMPVATYSIVAHDPATGELGVAVQSHWFSVGAMVPWVKAGVGAVATQSFVDPSYGPLGLELMAAGRSPAQALAGLIAADPGQAVRQVALVNTRGEVAAHTGGGCIQEAGHKVGAGYSVQANLMEKATVWPAMAEAFEHTGGDLAARMLAALKAAEAEGGDLRGRQSAALIVVRGDPTGRDWEDRIFDLRVEDDPAPLDELERLLRIARAYRLMNEGDLAVERGDKAGALKAYAGAEVLAPELYELPFWVGVSLAGEGRVDEALPKLATAYKGEPRLRELIPRLGAAGLLPDDPKLLNRLAGAK